MTTFLLALLLWLVPTTVTPHLLKVPFVTGVRGKATCSQTWCYWVSRNTTVFTVTDKVKTTTITPRKLGTAWLLARRLGSKDSLQVRILRLDSIIVRPDKAPKPGDTLWTGGDTTRFCALQKLSDGSVSLATNSMGIPRCSDELNAYLMGQ